MVLLCRAQKDHVFADPVSCIARRKNVVQGSCNYLMHERLQAGATAAIKRDEEKRRALVCTSQSQGASQNAETKTELQAVG